MTLIVHLFITNRVVFFFFFLIILIRLKWKVFGVYNKLYMSVIIRKLQTATIFICQ